MRKFSLKPSRDTVKHAKAMPSAAVAFFWAAALLLPAAASTNWVDGTAYGTNDLSTASSITSVKDGPGALSIGFAGTTNLTVSHDVEGYIILSNRIGGFVIDAVGGSVTGSQYSVLTVLGGTNLTVNGGIFAGTVGGSGIELPPLPGQPAGSNTAATAAMGGLFYETTNVLLSGTAFSGTTFNPDASSSYGTDGLQLLDSAGAVLSNGTFNGGDGGSASRSSTGGRGLYVENSSVVIDGGTFSGGAAGTAPTAAGGAGLHALDAVVTIQGSPVFTGGDNAAALYARNSDLTIGGGTFNGGVFDTTNRYFGLVSVAEGGRTNTVTLNGGTFNAIDFAGSGIQLLTAGSALQVDGYVVLDGSMLTVDSPNSGAFQHLLLRSGQLEFLNRYDLAAGGSAEFFILTNSYSTLSADSAGFETNSTIKVDATLASFTTGTNDITIITTANGIYVVDAAGSTNNATDANLSENVSLEADTAGRTHLAEVLVESGNNLVFRFTTQALKEYLNASGVYGDFIEQLEPLMPDTMNTIIDLLDDPEVTSEAIEQTYFTTFNSFQTALQGMRAAVGQSLSRGSEFRDQLKLLPPGARGPERNNHLRGWAKYYGNYYTRDRDGLNPEYDTILHGGVAGIDTCIGNLLLGVSGGSSHYRSTYEINAQADTVAYHGNFYGTYGLERGYIDAGIAYGLNQTDTRTADPFTLEGSFDAQLISGYLGGGYDLVDTGGGTVFTPEASLQYSLYEQDGYTERSTVAVPRVLDGYDADSLLSTLGMNVSMLEGQRMETFGYKADLRMHWMHEFNPDPSGMTFMLQGGNEVYRLSYPGLDEDLFRVGVGCSFFNTLRNKPKNILFRVDFDELFGDGFNSHNLSARLVYAF